VMQEASPLDRNAVAWAISSGSAALFIA
jgi:hypothetical protein